MKTQLCRNLVILFGALILLLVAPYLGQAAPPVQEPPSSGFSDDAALIDRVKQETDETVRVSYHAETGKVRFMGTTPGHSMAQPSILGADATTEEAARGFLATYGKLFGLQDPQNELTVMKERNVDKGRAFVRFQQTYQGVPVVGGELIVQTNPSHGVISANGEVLPDLNLDITPSITAKTARETALAKVAKDYKVSVTELTASEPELWIYNPMLLGGPGPRLNTLVWRIEVTPLELAPINEFVLIDAHLGGVVLHFNQIDTVLDLATYNANNSTILPGTLTCDETNPTCSGGDTHEVAAHVFAGDTYNFYNAEHSRNSIDDAGMTLISTVHYGSGYPNAYWSGSQMVYGDAYGFPLADDVVAHELTHGVTDYESQLFYFYQSGAINESFSDIWGEFVDQEQATGNDAGDTRWEIGEDISGLGAIRNMQDPTSFGDPDRMKSSNYYCEQSQLYDYGDNGGVHYNSGVGNKAAYLMTDGDTFNGYTVTGLGYAKVADLYYEVQTNLLTSAADYADLYDALIQAGINLGFSLADQQEIKDALDAVEMNQQPTGCSAVHAPVCSVAPTTLFFDDIESGDGNWIAGSNNGEAHWYVPQTSTTLDGMDEPYATSGLGNIWSPDSDTTSDTYLAMDHDVALSANTYAYMHFNHSFGFESNSTGSTRYDGGILEYSTNGGSSWTNVGSLFINNGYNGTLYSDNPLGAISAFSADSRGYISSRVNLSSLAGQNVRFRFRIGTDEYAGDYGWFIDDVHIYTCIDPPPPRIEVYMPIILRGGGSSGDTYEPNDTPAMSYGPLSPGVTYQSYIWTFDDFDGYYINITNLNPIVVNLTNIPAGTDYDLELYDEDINGLDYSYNEGNANEYIYFTPTTTGKYYILVYSFDGYSTTRPYSLRVGFNGIASTQSPFSEIFETKSNQKDKKDIPVEWKSYKKNF